MPCQQQTDFAMMVTASSFIWHTTSVPKIGGFASRLNHTHLRSLKPNSEDFSQKEFLTEEPLITEKKPRTETGTNKKSETKFAMDPEELKRKSIFGYKYQINLTKRYKDLIKKQQQKKSSNDAQ